MIRLAGAVLLLATLSAACGSAEERPQTTSTSAVDVTISMFEWGFGPSTVPIDVESSTVTVRIRNDGSILHEWVVLATPIEAETDFSRSDVLTSVSVEPGAVSLLEFTTPTAGTYQIVCPIAGHFSQGMEASLIVAP
jgi:uncharacterized cupredoxin-like copper-binding protein